MFRVDSRGSKEQGWAVRSDLRIKPQTLTPKKRRQAVRSGLELNKEDGSGMYLMVGLDWEVHGGGYRQKEWISCLD